MSTREAMIGQRIYDSDTWKPGEYGKHPLNGHWYCRTPNGELGCLSAHQITEHEDGTITVSPSILVSSRDRNGNNVELWHGYLERGVWRSL